MASEQGFEQNLEEKITRNEAQRLDRLKEDYGLLLKGQKEIKKQLDHLGSMISKMVEIEKLMKGKNPSPPIYVEVAAGLGEPTRNDTVLESFDTVDTHLSVSDFMKGLKDEKLIAKETTKNIDTQVFDKMPERESKEFLDIEMVGMVLNDKNVIDEVLEDKLGKNILDFGAEVLIESSVDRYNQIAKGSKVGVAANKFNTNCYFIDGIYFSYCKSAYLLTAFKFDPGGWLFGLLRNMLNRHVKLFGKTVINIERSHKKLGAFGIEDKLQKDMPKAIESMKMDGITCENIIGGKMLLWGRGTSGQLSHGRRVNCLQIRVVEFLEGFVITHVSTRWDHFGFVPGIGVIFICGDGSFGQLRHGDYKSQCSPQQVSYFSSKHAEQVTCGMRHSLILVRGNAVHQVYGFGAGKCGQLGISTEKVKSMSFPKLITRLTNFTILNITSDGDHSTVSSVDGNLYTWGGGFGCAPDACVPQRISTDSSLKEGAPGWKYVLLLTREGALFLLSSNHYRVPCDPQKKSAEGSGSENSKEGIIYTIY